MTTYTDEVNIYNPDAISDAIDDAGNAYKSVITEVGSTGVKIHPSGQSGGGIVDYTLIDDDGMEVFEGGKSVAQFGSTSRIGKAYVSGAADNESHMELDFHSLKLIDKEGGTYFHVSDLREADGTLEVEDSFPGGQTTFALSYTATDTNYTVEIEDSTRHEVTSGVTKTTTSVTFDTAPSKDYVVYVTYETTSAKAKAFTFGTRQQGFKVGGMSFAEGSNCRAEGLVSHVEGEYCTASGRAAHSEGYNTLALGDYSHSEGNSAWALGYASHGEGNDVRAYGRYSHAEGSGTTAEGEGSHAEGKDTSTGIDPVSGNAVSGCVAAHAEGYGTKAVYSGAHAEGTDCQAVRENSHAEGEGCRAVGLASHAQNCYTIAGSNYQTALGKYNEADVNGDYAIIAGNGTSDSARSNALTIDWSGSAQLWHPDIERGTAPSSSIYGGGGTLQLVDKDGHQIGYLQPIQLANGTEGIQLGVSNSDSTDWNTIGLGFDANDNPTVSVSDADKWRNALGVTDSDWQTLTLGSAAKAYESGVLPVYRKCFNVVNLIGAVSPKSQVAAGGSFDVGQLPSGYRPKQRCCTVCQGSGNSVYLLSIATGGTISIERYRNGASANAAMSTTAWLPFNVTFICA